MKINRDFLVVIWIGRFSRLGGYGEATRNYFRALKETGLKVIAFDSDIMEIVGPSPGWFDIDIEKKKDEVIISTEDPNLFFVTIMNETPDKLKAVNTYGRNRFIGHIFFETNSLPVEWLETMLNCDEIWTASQFNKDVFSDAGIPGFMLKHFPLCINYQYFSTDVPKMDIKELNNFVFLSIVSNFNRKDIGMLLRAYIKTFYGYKDVSLILKTMPNFSNKDFDRYIVDSLSPEYDIDDPNIPHIYFLKNTLGQDRIRALFKTCDIYVSIERGKGWDVPAMEAMACGKPVIGIDWSANQEFMNDDNSFLVKPQDNMVFVDQSLITNKKLYTAQMWPDVNEDDVYEQFKHAYEDEDLRIRKAESARRDIKENLSLDRIGKAIEDYLVNLEKYNFKSIQNPKINIRIKPIPQKVNKPAVKKPTGEIVSFTLNNLILKSGSIPLLRFGKKYKSYKDITNYYEKIKKEPFYFKSIVEKCISVSKFNFIKKYRLYKKMVQAVRNSTVKIKKTNTTIDEIRKYIRHITPDISNDKDKLNSREILAQWVDERVELISRFYPLPSKDEEISRLKSLHNRYYGNRIFIIGNGPSLNKLPLDKLKNEYTFGVNKIYLLFDKISWRPSFYTCLDWRVIPDSAYMINQLRGMTFFFPERFRGLLREGDDVYWYWSVLMGDNIKEQFNTDITKGVRGKGTILFTAIQIAYYLGFTEIYLIGADTTYKILNTVKQEGPDMFGTGTKLKLESTQDDDPNHFAPNYFGKGSLWHDPNVDEMKRVFTYCRKAIEANGRKIYNATKGGELEVFERVDFDSLFPKNSN